MGWPLLPAWAEACRFGEESQQPTWPQLMHIRRWTHQLPVRRQSSQPSAEGTTSWIWSRCEQIAVEGTDISCIVLAPGETRPNGILR